ncbi:signal recognition particle-docking protein FtsY [Suttonella ornithocola]|uniref:Signal recognition particle receptor FtsY n=1 Tax=Suttonella ornithocola TaxID=279832 RepID=A0A380MZJ9_9GAMM|nr:signal recognition particle-docking protein FtsY [Suttonella ornithocola]SUO97688.1 Cell division protein FtsY [Suttonella ornithocola]
MVFNWFKKSKKTTTETQETSQQENEDIQNEEQNNQEEAPSETAVETEGTTFLNETIPSESLSQEKTETPQTETEKVDTLETEQTITETPAAEPLPQPAEKPEKTGYFARLRDGLAKTRNSFADLFLGKKALDQDLIDELEMRLLTADVGMEITEKIITQVTEQISRNQLNDAQAVQKAVAEQMETLLQPYEQPLDIETHQPYVILMVGINGAGKTTTIGKLAHQFKSEGKKVMLAAGDTFRAAAVEQLQTWGERNNVPVIAQKTGADSASVAYDALQSAKARSIDVLIIDTAGRLHTQDHLMEELKKVKRVLQKLDGNVPHQTLLVIDAGNGQNALRQAQHFNEAMQLDGIVITKLDGTAKGGIIFAITEKLKLPIRFIGVGEKADDLRPFNVQDFVKALLYTQ